MAHECLLRILQDLSADDFKQFQWFLEKDTYNDCSIPKYRLETATRLQTVDLMIHTYPDRAVAVTKNLLVKIERNDLVGRLSEAGSGCKGAAATPQTVTNSQDVDEAAEEKLGEVRDEFVKRVSGPVLNALLDKLLTKKVIIDEEMEDVGEEHSRAGKARKMIDMVRKKGNGPSSEMIGMVRKLDPNLSKLLGL